jgi:hypothetical protein
MDGQTKVIAQVIQERRMQDRQWGGTEHDDKHFTSDWLRYIDHQIEKGCEEDADGSNNWRARYVKIAALAVAAVEAIDRKAV